jgi:hypothetical protein
MDPHRLHLLRALELLDADGDHFALRGRAGLDLLDPDVGPAIVFATGQSTA